MNSASSYGPYSRVYESTVGRSSSSSSRYGASYVSPYAQSTRRRPQPTSTSTSDARLRATTGSVRLDSETKRVTAPSPSRRFGRRAEGSATSSYLDRDRGSIASGSLTSTITKAKAFLGESSDEEAVPSRALSPPQYGRRASPVKTSASIRSSTTSTVTPPSSTDYASLQRPHRHTTRANDLEYGGAFTPSRSRVSTRHSHVDPSSAESRSFPDATGSRATRGSATAVTANATASSSSTATGVIAKSSSSSKSAVSRAHIRDVQLSAGLDNLGNTCFMNSVLQCLSHSPLSKYFLADGFQTDIANATGSTLKASRRGLLATASADVVRRLHKSSSPVRPSTFKSQIGRTAPRFSGYQQHDAQEFLRAMLDGIHDDINTGEPKYRVARDNESAEEAWGRYTARNKSPVIDIFGGQLQSQVVCQSCRHPSTVYDPFLDLSLEIPKSSSSVDLYACLAQFTKTEDLTCEPKYKCEKCERRVDATKTLRLHRLPPTLVVHLKRFTGGSYVRRKLSTKVSFPLRSLDLSGYLSSGSADTSAMYDLFGVTYHHGSGVGAGHYTARCLSAQWADFNDSRTRTVSESHIGSEDAYILFYQRRDVQQSRF